jgi:23S rRNA pseudouridine1911/1915/1917 synthase
VSSESRCVALDRGDAGQRLDLVLCRHLRNAGAASRTRVQRWIHAGRVTVNAVPVRRAAARLAPGDLVRIVLPEAAPPRVMAPEEIPIDVLYEDPHLLALDKPPGVVVHPTYRHQERTVMNALLWRARDWPASTRPSIVGRLDKLTSGIVVVAKTSRVHAALQRILGSPAAEKDYLAVTYGRVPRSRGRIDLPLRKDPVDRRRVVSSEDGAPSSTEFERLASVPACDSGLSLLRCRLLTGRTHQIRVHLATSGWPLVGDPTYGEPRWSAIQDRTMVAALRSFTRQALHAWRLVFTHPVTRERLTLRAPIPADLAGLLRVTGLDSAPGADR